MNRGYAPSFDFAPFLSGRGCVRETIAANEVVFSQGDATTSIYYIERGKAKIAVTSSGGKEVVLAIVGPRDFFGYSCLRDVDERTATVTVIADCALIRIGSSAMKNMLDTDAHFSRRFLAYVLNHNASLATDRIDQMLLNSEERLARRLLQLADRGAATDDATISVKLSQETLAEMVGTTRARISTFMNKFRRLGLIDYDSRTIHVNRSLLTSALRDRLNGTFRKMPEQPAASGQRPAASGQPKQIAGK